MKPSARGPASMPMPDARPHVPNYLLPAIISTCCFCGLPFGVVSIIYAVQVNRKAAAGDFQGAIDASQKSKRWLIVAIIVGLLGGVVSGILQLVFDISGR